MLKNVFLGLLIMGATGDSVYAISCLSGCGPVTTTISDNMSSSENTVGHEKNSSMVSDPVKTVKYDSGTAGNWGGWYGEQPLGYHSIPSTWQYKKIDDYISIALLQDSACEQRYFPFYGYTRDANTCGNVVYAQGEQVSWSDANWQSRIKVTKKIVNGTYSKKIPIAEWGQCQPFGCTSKNMVIRRVDIDLNITVPQSCELNAGQVINIDFGNVSSGAFKNAGAIAEGIQPQSKTVSVKCDNIAGNAQLTLRMQADKTSGNIVVSDENNDVGFRVTNNSGTTLIPNNLSSVIPFTLDSNARQNVIIQAYPVSVTGNKPTEGPVTSRAYLRVDFP